MKEREIDTFVSLVREMRRIQKGMKAEPSAGCPVGLELFEERVDRWLAFHKDEGHLFDNIGLGDGRD